MEPPLPVESMEEALAARTQAGQLEAFDQIARQYQTILLRFVRRNFGNLPDSEDVVQDALLKAFVNIGKFQPAWPLKTWLLTITFRTAVSHVRRHQTDVRLLDHHKCHGAATAPAKDIIADRDTIQNIWDTAAKLLTPTQYRAVWLLYIEEMDREQIANILGKSRTTIKLILYRATRKLQAYYDTGTSVSTDSTHVKQVIQGISL